MLKQRGVLISDGAWGTQLAQAGLPAGQATELWNVEYPNEVEKVARQYVEAGSDIILTNTFGGSRIKLEKVGLADRVEELNRTGTEISRRAAGTKALVFPSIGPTGEFVAPLGARNEEEFVAVFAEQMAACAKAGADGFVIETMSALEEALAALKAARQVARHLPVVVSFTFDRGARGFATMMGLAPEKAAAECDKAGADIIGANCGNGIAHMIEIARLMRASTRKPLWIKANAGMPKIVAGRTVFPESPAEMAARVGDLLKAGADIIGGCCGTSPEHIRAMAAAAAEAARK
jgi:5-methyltetrahydrofolate--homocysteine methyltransferase